MDKERIKDKLENFEELSEKLLDVLFSISESYRRENKDEYARVFPPAAMAVQESLRTFSALIKRK